MPALCQHRQTYLLCPKYNVCVPVCVLNLAAGGGGGGGGGGGATRKRLRYAPEVLPLPLKLQWFCIAIMYNHNNYNVKHRFEIVLSPPPPPPSSLFHIHEELNWPTLLFKKWKLNRQYALQPDKEYKFYLLCVLLLFGVIYLTQAVMLFKYVHSWLLSYFF